MRWSSAASVRSRCSTGAGNRRSAVVREQAPTWLIQMPWLLTRDERIALRQSLAGVGAVRMLREGKRLFAALAEHSAYCSSWKTCIGRTVPRST